MFVAFAAADGVSFADASGLTEKLKRLVAAPDRKAITALVQTRRDDLIQDPELAVLATIALRESGQASAAAALARDAQSGEPALHPRLLYEEAFSIWHGGDCRKAMPLFMQLRKTGKSGDALRLEAATMLVICSRDSGGWRKSINPVMGYSDDLGGVGQRKTITPEPGSRLDRIITFLADAAPDSDIPRTITIGTAPVSGMWFGGRGHLGRIRHMDGIRRSLHITGEGRTASRGGYRHMGITVVGRRAAATGRIRPVTAITLEGRLVSRKSPSKDLNEIALGIDQSWRVVGPYNFDSVLGLRSRQSRTRAGTRSDIARKGVYGGIIHQPGEDAPGWEAEIFMGRQSGTLYHAADFRRISLAAGPVKFGDGGRLYAGHSLERLDYTHARPWLAAPHEETRKGWYVRLTYPFGQGTTLGVSLNLLDRNSPDALENGRKLALDMEFYF